MTKERLEAFTDAVLAIIMTILVLDLDAPESPDFAAVWALRESYFAYALSFFWIGFLWINLYRQWQKIEWISGRVLWIDVIMLFFASLIPYVTNFTGNYFYTAFAQGSYVIIVTLVTVANLFLNKEMARANIENEKVYRETMQLNRYMIIDIVIKIIGFFLAIFVWPPLSMIFIVAATALMSYQLSKMAIKKRNSSTKKTAG